jgi:thiamine-phosphate pyrophosphorylase
MNKTYRVIDANVNRSKEGLRVMEDICRFILDDAKLTNKVKYIRHQVTKLVNIPDALLVACRGSDEDVARGRSVPRRQSTKQIFTANTKRATEALRVLEEFLPNGNQLKDLRYLVYDLEKVINKKLNLALPFEYDVYVVSDSPDVLKKAVDNGAAIVQLRDKNSDKKVIYQKALEVVEYKKEHDFIFILNDDPWLAKKVGADGVHVGQDEKSLKKIRRVVGPDMIIGRTTHSLAQGLQAQKDGVNYISVGPIFPTPTKPGRPAVGLEYVREAAANIEIPFVTIGGIDLKNIDKVLKAGARTIGIVRAHNDLPKILNKVKSKK